jgi:hypothetical protein
MSNKQTDKYNENLQFALDETMHALKQETEALLKLIDAMIVSSEERNQVIGETISELKKLIK